MGNTNATGTTGVVVNGPGSVATTTPLFSPTLTPAVTGTTIENSGCPSGIPTTLEGLLERRLTSRGLLYVYAEGESWLFPQSLSPSVFELSLTVGGPVVAIINDLRGLTIQPITMISPRMGIQNQYYLSGGRRVDRLRLVVNSPNTTTMIVSSNTASTTTVVIYNFAEPTDQPIEVVPGANMTLVGSGIVLPANSVVFIISTDGQTIRRMDTAALLRPLK